MGVIIFEKKTGKQKEFAHIIDAKEAVAGGSFVEVDPNKKKIIQKEESKVEKKVEPKPEPKIEKEEPKKEAPKSFSTSRFVNDSPSEKSEVKDKRSTSKLIRK